MKSNKEYLGEFLGTFILVLTGCGSVAVAVLYYPLELWQVAVVWGLGVALAIYVTKHICPAHLNPAVSIAMFINGNLKLKKLAPYILFQLIGAALAGATLLFFINTDLTAFELLNGITRGDTTSYHSAVMFGEFYPNPGYEDTLQVSHLQACIAEFLGTFSLVLSIFLLTTRVTKLEKLIPLFIGLTVTVIICIVAPYTQAGLNPARDFGPRLIAYFSGWEEAAFPAYSISFLTVYILSPILGGVVATYVHKLTFS